MQLPVPEPETLNPKPQAQSAMVLKAPPSITYSALRNQGPQLTYRRSPEPGTTPTAVPGTRNHANGSGDFRGPRNRGTTPMVPCFQGPPRSPEAHPGRSPAPCTTWCRRSPRSRVPCTTGSGTWCRRSPGMWCMVPEIAPAVVHGAGDRYK